MEDELHAVGYETTLVSSYEELASFVRAIDGKTSLSFDLEGVRLSRTGTATLAAVGVNGGLRVHVFLFDLISHAAEYYSQQMSVLKSILEDAAIIKIIHDCRQDSDSLNEFFEIRLRGVFDSSVYNMMINQTADRTNLNRTLESYSCQINAGRTQPHNFYIQNPTYWADRPLTEEKIAYAAADVSSLFELHEKMLSRVIPERTEEMRAASESALDFFRSLRHLKDIQVLRCPIR